MTNGDDRPLRYLDTPLSKGKVPFSEKETTILNYINQKVAAGESLKDIIDFIFRETRAIMPCDRIGIAFAEEDNTRLVLYHVIASYQPVYLTKGYTADIRKSSLNPVIGASSPRIINDLEVYYRAHGESESTRLLLKEGVLSSMTCPLVVDGRTAGLLFRSSRMRNAYTEREVSLHLAMAERLSQAVEKAWRIEQLASAFNSYMEMLVFVAHELKSPLSSIITMGKTLTAGYYGPLDDKPRDVVNRMVTRAEYLIGLSDEYLTLSRIESGNLAVNMKETDIITEVIDDALEIMEPQFEANHVIFEKRYSETLPRLNCDPELMKIVMVNLLGNAVKYGKIGGKISVSVSLEGGSIKIAVWNEGPGFPEEEKKRLFKKFSRLQTKELMGRKGSGIGLYMSWKAVLLHGGSLKADSKAGEWAEFTVELPVI